MLPVERVNVGDFLVGYGLVSAVRNFSNLKTEKLGIKTVTKGVGKKHALDYAALCSHEEFNAYMVVPDSIVFDVPGNRVAFKIGEGKMVSAITCKKSNLSKRLAA